MDIRRISSFLTSQTMGIKDICILVVHDDLMYQHIIAEILQNCSHYEVMKMKRIADALNIIREKIDRLRIVFTDVDPSDSNENIFNYIKGLKLRVVPMNPHQNSRVVHVGIDTSAKLYLLKSLSMNDFTALWQHAYTKEKGKETTFPRESMIQEEQNETSLESKSTIRKRTREDPNNKRIDYEETDEQSGGHINDSPNGKKRRVVWDGPLKDLFNQAIEQLGNERPVPKRIMEIMNVPGLTRENIASHLQKHRKREQERRNTTSSVFGINSTPLLCFQSSHPDFFSTETNHLQYQTQKPVFTSYQPKGSLINTGIPISNLSYHGTSTSYQQQILATSTQESPNSPYAHNTGSISKTQSNTCSINITPLSSLFYSIHSEASTSTSNLEQQNFVTMNNQESRMSPFIHYSPLLATTHVHRSPLIQENQPHDSLNNSTYVGFRLTSNGESVKCGHESATNISDDITNKEDFSIKGNVNEILVQFPSTEGENNPEQRFYVPPAEYEFEDLLNETGETTNPQIIFDLDASLLHRN